MASNKSKLVQQKLTVKYNYNYNKLQCMKERTFEKENNSPAAYQIRTKQYSPAPVNPQKQVIPSKPKPKKQFNYYDANAFENKSNLYEQTPQERLPSRHYAHEPRNDISNRPMGIGNYAKNKYQPTPKIDFNDKKPRTNNINTYSIKQINQDTFADHSFGEGSLQVDINPPNKRQNVKRKGLEMKMTNIENINDKINSLLNMVKKDKVERSSIEKNYQNSPKRTESPSFNRVNILANFQALQEKQSKLNDFKNDKMESYKEINKSHKRLKTYSAVQSSKNDEEHYYDKIKQSNQEDRWVQERQYNPSTYSPARNRNTPKDNYDKTSQKQQYPPQKIEYNQFKYSPIKQRNQKVNAEQNLYPNSSKRTPAKNAQKTASKYEKIDLPFNNSPSAKLSYYQKRQKTPPKQNDNLMPMTLIQENRSQKSNFQKMNEKSEGMKLIDNQIRKIKEKINQSEYQNKKYQDRLVDGREERVPANAGKIYTKEIPNSNKKFQIKVYPVINEKPQTIKIVEKLCYQIEVDSRMRKSRQAFQQMAGEQKWKDLESKLNKNGVRLTIIEIKELLTISPDQFSPFDSEVTSQLDIVKPFIDAQKFWENEVCGCANSRALRSEGFNINELDLNKTGFLSIEDLVCFVNLYSGHFYKNRDLTIIFKIENTQ